MPQAIEKDIVRFDVPDPLSASNRLRTLDKRHKVSTGLRKPNSKMINNLRQLHITVHWSQYLELFDWPEAVSFLQLCSAGSVETSRRRIMTS